MDVISNLNNVKVYDLSAGKSIPEWLSERKRRALIKKDVNLRHRIELIQDFDMPHVSNSVKVSKDGKYIIATGIYKPRVKCFDVANLSLKFERCFDSEAITFEILSDDYSKLVFLQCDRYVEFHAAHGRHHRLRIPKFGRDMKYHFPSCDLYVVGNSSDIYRFNLQKGQFMTPFTSQTATAINKCAINPVHQFLVCGTQEGRIEAWDPRSKNMISTLDCAFSCVSENRLLNGFPSITALKFNGALNLGVGTATGQILLYDIRSNKPTYVKDHEADYPIKDIEFHYDGDLVFSMDKQIVQIWDKNNGKVHTAIDAKHEYNNLCVVPRSGLFFIANETAKIQTYFVPSLGTAPAWAGYLDQMTEEMEETKTESVYTDYKFVTEQELQELKLDHLIGTNLLRAELHGYYISMKLYLSAKALINPYEVESFKKKKIRETIEKNYESRVKVSSAAKVNKDLDMKLLTEQLTAKDKEAAAAKRSAFHSRFKDIFENPDFTIDTNSDHYRLLNPVMSRLEDSNKKKEAKKKVAQEFVPMDDDNDGGMDDKNSSDESSSDDDNYNKKNDSESSDDDQTWTEEMKREHRKIQREHREKQRREEIGQQAKMYELKQGEEFKGVKGSKWKANRAPLGERLAAEDSSVRLLGSVGNREMTFSTNKKKRDKQMDLKNERHRQERKRLVRSGIKGTTKPSSMFRFKRK